MVKVHRLKTLAVHFERVLDGSKTFELRRDDRGFEVGHLVELQEIRPMRHGATNRRAYPKEAETSFLGSLRYTGRQLVCVITHTLRPDEQSGDGLRRGYVILSIQRKHT